MRSRLPLAVTAAGLLIWFASAAFVAVLVVASLVTGEVVPFTGEPMAH